MQYTSNFNLMLPEGTDIVNLLTQLNPNISDIDAAMFANKQGAVGRATELTSGTVHAITRANTDSPVFAWTATANWTAGDTMTVDGTTVSVFLADGSAPESGAYVINGEVLAVIAGTRVTLFVSHGKVTNLPASSVTYDAGTSVADRLDQLLKTVCDYEASNVVNGWNNVTFDISSFGITNIGLYIPQVNIYSPGGAFRFTAPIITTFTNTTITVSFYNEDGATNVGVNLVLHYNGN